MSVVISERFADQCSVVSRTNYDTCGTFTRANLEYLSPADLEALYVTDGAWHEMDAWFKHVIEMKMCGTPVVSMWEWIMGNARFKGGVLQGSEMRGSVSLMQPFIFGKQASVLNIDSWYLDGGWQQNAYTATVTGPLTTEQLAEGETTDRIIRAKTRYGVDMDEKIFNPETILHILSRAGSFVEDGQWKVLASAVAADRTYVDILMVSQNAGSSAPFDATPGASSKKGVVYVGRNNVADVEKWCHNLPNWDPNKFVPFWLQTSRRARCVDSEYIKAFTRLRTGGNDAFKAFGDLDMAQRNKQDETEDRKRFVRDFFFNKPISDDQTLADWRDLEDIQTPTGFSVDPGTGGKVMGKRANFIGVVEQLRRCDRVWDLTGQLLNFYELLDELYRIKRAREANGKRVTDLDIWTDSVTAANLHTGFLAYWKQESLETLATNIEFGDHKQLGLSFQSYKVKRPAGVRINIIVDNFFDDFRDANDREDQEPVGSMMAILDIGGSIYWAPTKSNRKVHTVGQLEHLARIDKDWACVMESVTKEQTLISDQGTAVVECPHENLWIWGMGDGVPIVTGPTEDEGNLY
jgi:hypothetical protein